MSVSLQIYLVCDSWDHLPIEKQQWCNDKVETLTNWSGGQVIVQKVTTLGVKKVMLTSSIKKKKSLVQKKWDKSGSVSKIK